MAGSRASRTRSSSWRDALAGVGLVDRMPGRQVEIIARRDLGARTQRAPVAEQRHHRGQAQVLVEIGAADVDAAGGEDVVAPLRLAGAAGTEAHQRKVGGAAADVGDQDQFLAVDLGFVVEGGGDRLVLEGDLAETDVARDFRQRVLGQLVGHRIVVDEKYRAAEDRALETASGLGFGAALDLADELGQQQPERQRTPRHFGLAVHQAGPEQAFQRAHQAPFVAGQVVGQGRAAIAHFLVVGIEKHHRGQCRLAVFERQQRVPALRGRAWSWPDPANRGVRRTEVDAASVRHVCLCRRTCFEGAKF